MSTTHKIQIPKSAIAELDEVEQMDWEQGIGLQELIDWINQIVERFRPDSITANARSSAAFGSRSFRHYQTLGCIDAPKRAGKSVTYGFKHYLQGLVIRKLLWEKIPSEQIARLMDGKDTGELKRLLFEGIEIVAARGSEDVDTQSTDGGTWKRVVLAPGVELHLEPSLCELSDKDINAVVEKMHQLL